MTDLTLSSPAFGDETPIPRRYGYTADNVNPPLLIGGAPAETESFALIVENPNPARREEDVWNHWLVWNIPPDTEEIPEGWGAEGATEGQNDFGEHGYGGPTETNSEQQYRFRLYALETSPNLPASAEKEELVDAIIGNILDKAKLQGIYRH